MSATKSLGLGLLAAILGGQAVIAADNETQRVATWDGKIVQHGKMHEAIGQKQHQGRVQLGKLVERPNFYGVAALAGLEGEATIVNGKVTVTQVDAKGRLEPVAATPDQQATLLVGAYVPSWTEHKVSAGVEPDALDRYVAEVAERGGLETSQPFVFIVEGEFSHLRLHVINGACPLHARLRKIELPKENQPVEVEKEQVRGTLVGVFAKDAVGNITHPATSTHMHLVFQDEQSGTTVTGHVERIGLLKGAVLRLPKSK
jgi:alpha-acetolactate decarboxylase